MKAKNVVHPVALDPRTAVYHLKVHVLNISPMIYRRFIIDGNTHIAELHHLIQMMMGWENQHLHVFHIWGVDYGIAYEGGTLNFKLMRVDTSRRDANRVDSQTTRSRCLFTSRLL